MLTLPLKSHGNAHNFIMPLRPKKYDIVMTAKYTIQEKAEKERVDYFVQIL